MVPSRLTIFGRMFARSTALLPTLLIGTVLLAQPLLDRVRIDLLNGRVEKVLHDLDSALAAETGPSLMRCRLLEAKGETFHRLSDIGEAQRLWTEALHAREQLFGDSSAEAAVGHAFQARYHNYMAAPHLDHCEVAWREATHARRLLVLHPGRVSDAERILIHREAGYAYKIAFGELEKHDALEGARALYRRALALATSAHDTIWMAQVIHDIGNTFHDEAVFYGWSRSRAELQLLIDSTLLHYGRSIMLMEAIGMGTSEAVMMDHFTTALLIHNVFGPDSLSAVIEAYDRALRTMLRQVGHPASVDPLLFESRITNKAQMVELLYLRATAIANYPQGTNVPGLRAALSTVEAAAPYWEAMLREYQGRDIHKVVGSYSHFPFRIGTRLLADLYRSTGDTSFLNMALVWFDRNRGALEQRKLIRSSHIHPAERIAPSPTTVLPTGTACVAIHEHSGATLITMGAGGIRTGFMENDTMRRHQEEIQPAYRTNDPVAYRRAAFALYQGLLQPALSDPAVQDLVIVPGESFERIPMEALVTDTLGPATWGGLHYVIDRCAIRYARTIHEALMPAVRTDLHDLRVAMAHAPNTAELPFAEELAHKLTEDRPLPGADLSATRAELLALLSGTQPVHFASHGVVPTDADALPYLLLADGELSLLDLDDSPCNSPFVVLSTCSSGDGRIFLGEGMMSIGNALLRNGAGGVVRTLWPVDDQATSELLGSMYAGMEAGASAAEALRTAKQAFIARHRDDALSNPIHWSGVVLSGRDVRPDHGPAWWPAAVAGGVLVLGGVGYRSLKRSRRSRALPAN